LLVNIPGIEEVKMIYVNLTLPRIDEVNMIKKVNYIFGTEEFNMIYYD